MLWPSPAIILGLSFFPSESNVFGSYNAEIVNCMQIFCSLSNFYFRPEFDGANIVKISQDAQDHSKTGGNLDVFGEVEVMVYPLLLETV